MRVTTFVPSLLVALGVLPGVHTVAAQVPQPILEQDVVVDLDQPVDLAFLPDGRLLVAEKGGRIVLADPDLAPSAGATYLDLAVESADERGLVGLAIDPQFATDPFVYAFYLPAGTVHFRLSRFVHAGATADPASEEVLWQDPDPALPCCHYGGGLEFGPGGHLFLSLGEKFRAGDAQDLARPGGKVLRFHPDGSIPADNPFADGPGGALDAVWCLGLRNPFRLRHDEATGRLYVGEVGGNDQLTAQEDLYEVFGGANYGWPFCEGDCPLPLYEDPLHTYAHDVVDAAIVCGDVLRAGAFGPPLDGALVYGDYARGKLFALELEDDGSAGELWTLDATAGPVTSVVEGPDGGVYVTRFAPWNTVARYLPAGDDPAPTIGANVVGASAGLAPLAVTLVATAADPEEQPVDVVWDLGDGTTADGAVVTHVYATNGVFAARASATDGTHTVDAPRLEVTVGVPPVVTITAPVDGATFRAGDLIPFAATATDADGDEQAVTLSWRAEFLHESHVHPAFGPTAGASGEFFVEPTGHDYAGETGYRFVVTATDADGLAAEASVVVRPEKVHLTFDSVPSGVPVRLDGIERATPFVHDTLVGFEHDLSVAERSCLDGEQQTFVSWNDGGARERTLVVPASSTTVLAEFVSGGACDPPEALGLVAQYEASRGVTTAGGDVIAWGDLTANANHLSMVGQPTLLAGAVNGFDAVRFDGVDDLAQRLGGLAGFPTGNAARSMFLVARWTGGGCGGVTYGSFQCGRAFGLGIDPLGHAVVPLWCGELDSGVPIADGSWQVVSVLRSGDYMSQWLDTFRIAQGDGPLNTGAALLRMGGELDGTAFVPMDVAEVLVYDRDFNVAEREGLQRYLRAKYSYAPPATGVVRWTGAVDGAWDEPGNWSAGVPDATDVVSIPATAPAMPAVAVDASVVCRELVLEPGASLALPETATLAVADGVRLEGLALGTGTLRVTGAATLVSDGVLGWALEVDAPGEVLLPEGLDLAGDLRLFAGSLAVAGTVGVGGTLTVTGGELVRASADALVVVAGTSSFAGTESPTPPDLRVAGNWSATTAFAPTAGTVELIGLGTTLAAPDGGPLRFAELVVSGSTAPTTDLDVLADSLVVAPAGDLDVGTVRLGVGATRVDVAGRLVVREGGTFAVAGELAVTGTLRLEGDPGAPATLEGDGASPLRVDGTLEALEFVVRAPGPGGLELPATATLGNGPFDLRNGRFEAPADAPGSVLLTLDRTGPTTVFGAEFFDVADAGTFNVRSAGPGTIDFSGAAGDFVGPTWEDDPADVVAWDALHSAVTSFTATPGPEAATLRWSTATEPGNSNFVVERDVDGVWTQVHFASAAGAPTDYAFTEPGLAADVEAAWRLVEVTNFEAPLVHGTVRTTPWTTTLGYAAVRVGPTGTFATIQEALDAAAGERLTLFVEPGTQPAFVLDGALVPPVVHLVGGPTTIDTSSGPVVVRGVPAGGFVELTELELTGTPATGLVVEDCSGAVVLDELVVSGGTVTVDDAPRTALQRSTLALGTTLALVDAAGLWATATDADAVTVGDLATLTSAAFTGSVTVDPGGTWDDLVGAMPEVEVPDLLPLAEPTTVRLEGTPGRVWMLFSGPRPGWFASPDPRFELPLLIDVSQLLIQGVGVFDTGGSFEFAVALPPLSTMVGRRIVVQLAEYETGPFRLRFSNGGSLFGIP